MSNIPESAVGLCAGRHNIPVEKYIFTEVPDVMDFRSMNSVVAQFILKNCNPRTTYAAGGPAQDDYIDVCRWTGDPLDVVVTGLTQCTTTVMWGCACYGIPLTLWHYNRDTGDYVPQRFDF
jgi:hypothetical protein